MGNCQAAEVATVVVQHPENGKVDRIYWSISAKEVMSSNPGYYVALVVETPSVPGQPSNNNNNNKKKKNHHHLKLLRPEDTMHIGHVYRLISFEDVIKEFSEKKSTKLGKLIKSTRACEINRDNNTQTETRDNEGVNAGSKNVGGHHGVGQWRPVLNSIAEF